MAEITNGQIEEPVKLAVFDFDGTIIDGSSTVRLVLELLKKRELKLGTGAKIGLWGLAYKFQLPQNESWVRAKLFKAFAGHPADEVDRYLREYYDKVCEPLFREQAGNAMQRHHDAGCKVAVISASFDPIVEQLMIRHPVIDFYVATRMVKAEDGTYVNKVEGKPTEGAQKVVVLTEKADELFGRDNWEITYAYADHDSDHVLLDLARHPYAVCPNNPMKRHAKEQGWPILEW